LPGAWIQLQQAAQLGDSAALEEGFNNSWYRQFNGWKDEQASLLTLPKEMAYKKREILIGRFHQKRTQTILTTTTKMSNC